MSEMQCSHSYVRSGFIDELFRFNCPSTNHLILISKIDEILLVAAHQINQLLGADEISEPVIKKLSEVQAEARYNIVKYTR